MLLTISGTLESIQRQVWYLVIYMITKIQGWSFYLLEDCCLHMKSKISWMQIGGICNKYLPIFISRPDLKACLNICYSKHVWGGKIIHGGRKKIIAVANPGISLSCTSSHTNSGMVLGGLLENNGKICISCKENTRWLNRVNCGMEKYNGCIFLPMKAFIWRKVGGQWNPTKL